MKLSANIVKIKLKLTIPRLKGFVHFTTVDPICISDVQNVQEFVIALKKEMQLISKYVNFFIYSPHRIKAYAIADKSTMVKRRGDV